jgi:enterochelin esterase-like enzyme
MKQAKKKSSGSKPRPANYPKSGSVQQPGKQAAPVKKAQPGKSPKPRTSSFSVMTTVLMLVVIFLIWRPTLFGKNDSGGKPVSVAASEFVPVDTNKALTDAKARLLVVTGFHATKLDNDRSLHIYLPPGYYENTDKQYPVLYVNDGKSVFELSDWSKESLHMHETADRLISNGKIEELIIVGVDNIGENRLGEYAQWDGVDQGKPVTGFGLLYEDFLLNDVKPFIDHNFRTHPDREHTALLGQSMGGFSAFNIAFRHPEAFGKLAMQSPYLGWGEGRLYELLDGPYKEKRPLQIWLDVGSTEADFVNMAAQGLLQLMNNGYPYGSELTAFEAPDGEHSERFWATRIESILLYFYGDIGKPVSAELFSVKELSLTDSTVRHINAVVTYDSGFKMTDFGTYTIEKPEVLKIDSFGGALYPLAEPA